MNNTLKSPAIYLAMLAMAMVLTFSCTSDDIEPPVSSKVSCQIADQCFPNIYTAEQCVLVTGTVVASCGGNVEPTVSCQIGNACIPDVYTAAQCALMGTVVGSCPTVVPSSSSNPNVTLVPTSSSHALSSSSSARSSSSAAASSSSYFSSSSGPYTGQWYCDYGKPFTDELAGCEPVVKDSDCDLEYGKLVAGQTECGKRTDITYCNWGPPYYDALEGWQGGCWRIDNTTSEKSKCTNDYGNVVSQCPNNTLVRPSSSSLAPTPSSSSRPSSSSTTSPNNSSYCYYEDGYCYIIGAFYRDGNLVAYFQYASTCTSEGGTVETRSWCVSNSHGILDD
jgi:hypothetical protein